jgi:hypothetical protein
MKHSKLRVLLNPAGHERFWLELKIAMKRAACDFLPTARQRLGAIQKLNELARQWRKELDERERQP